VILEMESGRWEDVVYPQGEPSDLEPTGHARDGRVAERACGECPRQHDFPRGCRAGLSTHGRHGAEQAPPRTPNNDGGGR
jgi:hypothetical protein